MKKLLSVGLSLALVFTLVGCGNNTKPLETKETSGAKNTTTESKVDETSDKSEETNTNSDRSKASSSESKEATNKKFLSIKEINKKALELAGNDGIVTKIELDKGFKKYTYEVEVETPGMEHEIEFNAETGEVTKHKKDKSNDYEKLKGILNGVMSIEEAVDKIKANSNFNNPFVHSIKLEEDDNLFKYEADVYSDNKEYDIEIDAKSGEVYDFELDENKFFDFDFDFDFD